MPKDYLPAGDDALLVWAGNFSSKIASMGVSVGITTTQSTEYADLKDTYAAALAVAKANITRSPTNVLLKNDARRILVDQTRVLVKVAQAFPSTTDAQRSELGINIRKPREQQQPPQFAPRASVLNVNGHTFTVAADDPAAESKRKKLAGTVGVWWYAYVGEEYPGDPGLWEFCGQSNRYSHEITLPLGLTAGTRVYFTAAWVDRKGQTGPVAVPAFGYVEYSGAANAQKVKLAA